ncbi:MAG: alkaline phosphatase family protein [Verrucomicrobium sp.]
MNLQKYEFVISREAKSDAIGLWRFDPSAPELFTAVPLQAGPGASLDCKCQVIQVGAFLLEWGPLVTAPGMDPSYPYRLLKFDPTSPTPLTLVKPAVNPLQSGMWPKSKFFWIRADFGHEGSDIGNFSSGTNLSLMACGNFVLNCIPTAGRGTFKLFHFDPCQPDPLPEYGPQGAFSKIALGHELIYIADYVLDWVPGTGSSTYAVWSFDPQAKIPITQPTIQQGVWDSIDASHRLTRIGEYILDWVPDDLSYRLYKFDPTQKDPLGTAVQTGRLSASLSSTSSLLAYEPNVPINTAQADVPGTLDYMRSKVKHVVYLMIENRSFDHVCGWLYENDKPALVIGPQDPFKGASTGYFNYNGDKEVHLSKFRGGRIDESKQLEVFTEDPYHDNSDVMKQLFYSDPSGYEKRAVPDMGGFVFNNGADNVMETFTPEQLPVLNGLAKNFAVSDEWFCSMPGGTDVNRAFSLTGSALGQLNNFQNGPEYTYWPYALHRPSIFKALWCNGFTDWKIYNSVEWFNFVFTYHLFLQGQIATVDADSSKHIASIDQFYEDARTGNLASFTYMEPRWIAPQGTTSYHPGGDLVPGEQKLLEIFNALQDGPAWNETLFVITFDEHGGIYDHVPPPYAVNPYPNDCADGFNFDLMGVRVPTILISPLIPAKTVFRSETPVAYESTSILATLLDWYGVPRSQWGLGDRIKQAPTFEGVFLEPAPRQERVNLEPPYDKDNPRDGTPNGNIPLNGVHQLIAPRLIAKLTEGLPPAEQQEITDDIMSKATTLTELNGLLVELESRLKG